MKKILIIYLAILIGLYAGLSLFDRSGDYVIEQKLWKVHKEFAEVSKDPNVVPEQKFDDIANKYEAIIKKYPDSKLIQGVELLVAETYILKKDYAKAREKLNRVLLQYTDNIEYTAEVKARLGRSFEQEENWPEAEKVYQGIMKDHPYTVVGLSTPIYIANYHRGKNNFAETMKAYNDAISHYKNAAARHPKSAIEFTALRYLANCYLDQSRWLDAVNTLGEVLLKFPTPNYLNAQRADLTIKTINIVSAYQLKDYDVAINLYKKFQAQHPGHPLNEYLQKMINAFQKLREQNIEFATEEEAIQKVQE